jgi:hypothetical protein
MAGIGRGHAGSFLGAQAEKMRFQKSLLANATKVTEVCPSLDSADFFPLLFIFSLFFVTRQGEAATSVYLLAGFFYSHNFYFF